MRTEMGVGEEDWNAPGTRLEVATGPRGGRVVSGDPRNVTNRSNLAFAPRSGALSGVTVQ